MKFDFVSFSAFGAACEAVFILFIWFVPARFDSRRVLPALSFAATAALLGFLGFAGRGHLSDFLSIYCASILFQVAYVWLGRALRRLRSLPQQNRADTALLLGFAAVLFPPTFVSPDWHARTFLAMLFLLVITVRNLRVLFAVPPVDRDQRILHRLVAFAICYDLGYRLLGALPALLVIGDPAPSMAVAGAPSQFIMFNALVGVVLINTSFFWLAFDHTARESAEREERFRALAANAPGVIYLCDNDGAYTMRYLNEAVTDLTGFPPAAFLTHSCSFASLIHPDDLPGVRRRIDAALAHQQPFRLTYRLQHRNGCWRQVEEYGTGIFRDNTLRYLEGFIHDITERATLERQVHEREAFLRSVTERAPSLLFTARLQPDGTLTYPWASRPLAEVLHFDPGAPAVEGTHPFTSLHPDDRADGRRVLADSVRALTPIHATWRFNTRASGYRWTRVEATPYRDDGGVVNWFGSFTDIHDLKTATAALEERNRELLELVALKQRLLSIIAHDLKNPFAVILGISEHMARGTPGADLGKWQAIGKTTHEAALAAYDLLENMLGWARAKEMPCVLRRVEADRIVEQALAHNATAAARKDVVLRSMLPAGVAVTADQTMLTTVLRNLLANAVKFTPAGGTVTVTTTPVAGGLEFAVTDTGIGIAPDVLRRLAAGETGISTAGTGQEDGSGLGLSVCRELLARQGSALVISSEPEQGSRFSFILPAA